MSDVSDYMERPVGNPTSPTCTCCGQPRSVFLTMTGARVVTCYECDLVSLWPFKAA